MSLRDKKQLACAINFRDVLLSIAFAYHGWICSEAFSCVLRIPSYYLKLSLHRFLGFPLGLLPVTSPSYVHLLRQSVTINFLHSHLSPSLLLHNIHNCFLSKRSPHTSSILTLSSLVTPSTLLRNIISHACILLSCLLCIVHVSHP